MNYLALTVAQNASLASFLSLQERILRAVSGKGTADGEGLRVQEIPQEGWQKSAQGCQERDHDLENVRGGLEASADDVEFCEADLRHQLGDFNPHVVFGVRRTSRPF